MPVIDPIIRAIQASIDELLGEVDRLRRALAALTSRESERHRSECAAPTHSAAGERAAQRPRAATPRTPRARKAPAPWAPTPDGPAAAPAPARARTAPGATKAAILAALAEGGAMTAGEIAAATGLHRATVSTTLSKLAASGELAKAARGYQLQRERDAPPLEGAGEVGATD